MIDPSDTPEGRQEAMIEALREAFGDRALEVARRQLELAEGAASIVWERIVAALARE
jgi:hypothetical protein